MKILFPPPRQDQPVRPIGVHGNTDFVFWIVRSPYLEFVWQVQRFYMLKQVVAYSNHCFKVLDEFNMQEVLCINETGV
jgi:hypothetical protein